VKIYTIGFTKTSAESFFQRISNAKVNTVMDVRLRADSQLSGFAKKNDLKFFLKELVGIDYSQSTLLAPTPDILDAYKKGKMSWLDYEKAYINLIQARRVESLLVPDNVDGICFLCSEDTPHKCHRRLAAEYLIGKWGVSAELKHL
jgi:uncharacterized protein (DUF488 family)